MSSSFLKSLISGSHPTRSHPPLVFPHSSSKMMYAHTTTLNNHHTMLDLTSIMSVEPPKETLSSNDTPSSNPHTTPPSQSPPSQDPLTMYKEASQALVDSLNQAPTIDQAFFDEWKSKFESLLPFAQEVWRDWAEHPVDMEVSSEQVDVRKVVCDTQKGIDEARKRLEEKSGRLFREFKEKVDEVDGGSRLGNDADDENFD